jgi:hypothetical protein
MDKNLSIVLVDKRHHRKIAQDNWGLTDGQMKGKHVHHRIHKSKGGTNDPTNLYVCSPWFHQYGWHNGEEWIAWAAVGGQLGAQASKVKRETDPNWAVEESKRASVAGEISHARHKGTKEYSDRQRIKSLKSHIFKRKKWTEEIYDKVWELFVDGVESGYKIGKKVNDRQWKKYVNMLKYASAGFSFKQLTDTNEYLSEVKRLEESPIAHILKLYAD